MRAKCDWCHEINEFRKMGPRICKKCWANRANAEFLRSLPDPFPDRGSNVIGKD